MKVFSAKVSGCHSHVLFSGLQYIMFSEFYGLLAIADRKAVNGQFKLTIGNRHALGSISDGSIERAFKSIITKCERQFIHDKKVTYEVEYEDLADKNVQVIVK